MNRREPPAPTISETVAAWDRTLLAKAPMTARAYREGIRAFLTFLRAQGIDPDDDGPEIFGPATLEDFTLRLIEIHGRDKASTIAVRMAAGRSFVKFCGRRLLLAHDMFLAILENASEVRPRASYHYRKINPQLVRVLLHVRNLPVPPRDGTLQARPDRRIGRDGKNHPTRNRSLTARIVLLRDKALFEVLFSTGLRREEITRLNREDVTYSDQAVVRGKGDKERAIFLDQPTKEACRAYLAEREDSSPALFVGYDRDKGKGNPEMRLSTLRVWQIVKAYTKAAGVEGDVRVHDFRHLKARSLLNKGAPMSIVQAVLGHSSPATTQLIYARHETRHLREAFDRFSATADELAAELERLEGTR